MEVEKILNYIEKTNEIDKTTRSLLKNILEYVENNAFDVQSRHAMLSDLTAGAIKLSPDEIKMLVMDEIENPENIQALKNAVRCFGDDFIDIIMDNKIEIISFETSNNTTTVVLCAEDFDSEETFTCKVAFEPYTASPNSFVYSHSDICYTNLCNFSAELYSIISSDGNAFSDDAKNRFIAFKDSLVSYLYLNSADDALREWKVYDHPSLKDGKLFIKLNEEADREGNTFDAVLVIRDVDNGKDIKGYFATVETYEYVSECFTEVSEMFDIEHIEELPRDELAGYIMLAYRDGLAEKTLDKDELIELIGKKNYDLAEIAVLGAKKSAIMENAVDKFCKSLEDLFSDKGETANGEKEKRGDPLERD